MKFLASIAVVVLLFCGGALWFLAGGSLNEFIKVQIETVGKEVTEQNVSVKAVDMQLAKGAGSILDLTLANPKGYSYPHAFSLGEITLDINLESLTQSPIIIDAVIIKSPQAFVELQSNGGSNIKELLDIIETNLADKNKSDSANKEDNQSEGQPEPNLSITKVVLAGTALTADFSALGNKAHQLTLPDITLNNIGGEQGLPASEIGSVIVKEALSKIWKQTKKTQKKKLKEQAKDTLKDKAKKKLSELFNKS